MNSAFGIMVAGFIYGLVEAFVTTYFGSSYTYIVVFALLIVVLAAKPNGLFGLKALNKV